MKKVTTIIAITALMFATSCSKTEVQPQAEVSNEQSAIAARGGIIPNQQAYYDSTFFTINMIELSAQAAASIITHNQGVNEIYASEDLDFFPQTFHPVITAIPGDGFNPMWLQFLIVFNAGHAPHQFFSDTQVDAAVASGEIRLTNTGEIYRCAVVGH